MRTLKELSLGIMAFIVGLTLAVSFAKAEVNASKLDLETIHCHTQIFKEIRNGHMLYWLDVIGDISTAEKFPEGYDATSGWWNTRACLIHVVNEVADAGNNDRYHNLSIPNNHLAYDFPYQEGWTDFELFGSVPGEMHCNNMTKGSFSSDQMIYNCKYIIWQTPSEFDASVGFAPYNTSNPAFIITSTEITEESDTHISITATVERYN